MANDQEWVARGLDSLLGPRGYAVLWATSTQRALELVRSAQPDAVIVDMQIPPMGGAALCRALREEPLLGAATPIIVTSSSQRGRAERLQAFSAGAWDYCTEPLDAETLLLKLSTFIKARRATEQLRRESLTDPTGVYNLRGLARRAREIGADAGRFHRPLACIAFAPADSAIDEAADAGVAAQRLAERFAEVWVRCGRVSDAFGRVGANEFGIVASSADEAGARRLVERLESALANNAPDSPSEKPVRLDVSIEAVSDYSAAPLDAVEMLIRATNGLRTSRSGRSPGSRALDDPDATSVVIEPS